MIAISTYSGECDGLGLAVVPWQAYPIFALIKALFEKEEVAL